MLLITSIIYMYFVYYYIILRCILMLFRIKNVYYELSDMLKIVVITDIIC